MNFDRIKKNYDTQLWDKIMVHDAYITGIIDLFQYYLIVGTIEDGDVPEGTTKEELLEIFEEKAKEINY